MNDHDKRDIALGFAIVLLIILIFLFLFGCSHKIPAPPVIPDPLPIIPADQLGYTITEGPYVGGYISAFITDIAGSGYMNSAIVKIIKPNGGYIRMYLKESFRELSETALEYTDATTGNLSINLVRPGSGGINTMTYVLYGVLTRAEQLPGIWTVSEVYLGGSEALAKKAYRDVRNGNVYKFFVGSDTEVSNFATLPIGTSIASILYGGLGGSVSRSYTISGREGPITTAVSDDGFVLKINNDIGIMSVILDVPGAYEKHVVVRT